MNYRAVRSRRAAIQMLKMYSRLWRSRGAAFKAKQMEQELDEARAALSAAEDNVRRGMNWMFAIERDGPIPGEECRHFDKPTQVEIVLTAADQPGQCRLTFRHLAVGRDVSLDCRTEDGNIVADLIVRGEQALFDADQTGRVPLQARGWR